MSTADEPHQGYTFKCLHCQTIGVGEARVLTELGWRAKQYDGKWGDICPECRARETEPTGQTIVEHDDIEPYGTD